MKYRIKEVSERLALPVSTIRHWQSQFPNAIKPLRTVGGQRRYTDADLRTFKEIKVLVYEKKLTISEVRSQLNERPGNGAEVDWSGKTILLTGGTGSFGKHFCKVLLEKHNPKAIRVYSRDELKQFEMRQEFNDDPRLRFFIGDVRDGNRLRRAMEGVDFVVHAAAMKQVPACEYNPLEAVKTNVHGAVNIIDAALDTKVSKVVALSTDKAVNPANLYGATKLCSDKLITQANAYSGDKGTRFACVRYGNVIGSRGSVIPLFKKQRKTGSITITDDRMTRFWICLDDAVKLVLNAFRYMEGGEIFVPRIPSMRITDLAKAIAPECEVKHIGIRPGEKLHEALTGEDEGRHTVAYKGMYVIMPASSWWERRNYIDAKKLPPDFVYTSDNNEDWMSVEELRAIAYPNGIEESAANLKLVS